MQSENPQPATTMASVIGKIKSKFQIDTEKKKNFMDKFKEAKEEWKVTQALEEEKQKKLDEAEKIRLEQEEAMKTKPKKISKLAAAHSKLKFRVVMDKM